MVFSKGWRIQILERVVAALNAHVYFKGGASGEWLPGTDQKTLGGLQMPFARVLRTPEALIDQTNSQRRSEFGVAIVVFLNAPTDLEAEKCRAQEVVEEIFYADAANFDLGGLVDWIEIRLVDPGATSLLALGLEAGVFHPFGAVRIDLVAIHTYAVR